MDNEQARRTILYAYRHHWKDPAYVCRFCGRVEGMPHAAQCDGVRAIEALADAAMSQQERK